MVQNFSVEKMLVVSGSIQSDEVSDSGVHARVASISVGSVFVHRRISLTAPHTMKIFPCQQ